MTSKLVRSGNASKLPLRMKNNYSRSRDDQASVKDEILLRNFIYREFHLDSLHDAIFVTICVNAKRQQLRGSRRFASIPGGFQVRIRNDE